MEWATRPLPTVGDFLRERPEALKGVVRDPGLFEMLSALRKDEEKRQAEERKRLFVEVLDHYALNPGDKEARGILYRLIPYMGPDEASALREVEQRVVRQGGQVLDIPSWARLVEDKVLDACDQPDVHTYYRLYEGHGQHWLAMGFLVLRPDSAERRPPILLAVYEESTLKAAYLKHPGGRVEVMTGELLLSATALSLCQFFRAEP